MTKEQILATNEPRSVKVLIMQNSWGTATGSQGLQILTEDYIKSGYLKDCFAQIDKSVLVPQNQQTLMQQLLIQCQKVVPLLMRLLQLLKPATN